jgi:hypothetical protein
MKKLRFNDDLIVMETTLPFFGRQRLINNKFGEKIKCKSCGNVFRWFHLCKKGD